MPKCSARKAPIGPRRPNGEQQQIAGDDRRQDQRQMHEAVEQRLAPELAARQHHARSTMPSGRLTTIATVATLMDSRTAVHSSGLRSSHSIRSARCPVSSRRGARTREPLLLEERLRLGRLQERRGRPPRPAFVDVGGQRDRIDDRRMRVLREGADDLDARIGAGVGLVDDAERRLAASRRAPARRARSRPAPPCLRRAAQTPSVSSAALPYLPAGTALTSPMASRPSPSSPARSKPGSIVDRGASNPAGATSTMRLPSSFDRGVRLDQVLARTDSSSSRGRPR